MTRNDIRQLSRRAMLTGLLAGGAGAALGAPARSLRPLARPGALDVPRQLRSHALVDRFALPGEVSFVVADVMTGEVLDAFNPLLRQPPASTAKAITALYALDRLGDDHRFLTRLLATGGVVGGRLQGDLILAGGGDPLLDTDALGQLAGRLKAAGVFEVTGRFLVWPGALPRIDRIDPSQPEHVGYNPAVSGLNLNFNRVHFNWEQTSSGYDVALYARSASFSPQIESARMRIVDRKRPVYTYTSGERTDDWTVARWALGRGGARWLPVRRPALYAAEVFAIMARSHGIVLKPAEVIDDLPAHRTLAAWESPPLSSIARGMLRYSNNLTAEILGLSASAAGGVAPVSLAASARQMNLWLDRGIGRQPGLVDHSGLCDRSRIAAADMVQALVRLGGEAPLPPLLKPFPLGDGIIADVSVKTGTLNFVSALCGYLTTASGQPLAFAIFSSDLERRASLTKAERDRPEGGAAWAGRARELQRRLLREWASFYRNA